MNRTLPMTAATAPPRRSPAAATPGPVDPADRGRLSVSQRAAARIAVAALGEVDGLTGPVGRLRAAVGTDPEPSTHPQVDAVLTGSVAELGVRCGVVYPAPVGRTLDRARDHLVDRLRELAGLTVAHVDVAVVDLPVGDRPAAGRRSLS